MGVELAQLRPRAEVLSRAEALRCGVSASRIGRLVASGRWQRLHPGVYYVHGGQVPWRSRARAALVYAGAPAALALDAAAFAWGLAPRPPTTIVVAVPATRCVLPQPGLRITRSRRWSEPELRAGLRLTGIASTVLDLAARPLVSRDDCWTLVGSALATGKVSSPQLLGELARRGRHRWSGEIRWACGEDGAGITSALEGRTRRSVLAAHGITGFEAQVAVRDHDGAVVARRDFHHRASGVVIEVDGRAWHGPDRFEADRARDRAAAASGLVTLRFTWRDVADHPCRTAAEVVATLRARGWTGRVGRCGARCTLGLLA